MSTDFDNQVEDVYVINAINTAIAVVNIAEYLVTIQYEVSRVWKRKHSLVTYIFLANRFLTMLYSAASLAILGVSSRAIPHSCSPILIVQSTSLLLLFIVLALFSSFRVYALWNRDWKLPLLVFVLNIVPVGTDIYNYSSLRPREPFSVFRCASTPHIPKRDIFWFGLCNRFCVITADVLVLSSTWMKTLATQRESKRLGLDLRISHLLFRDGTVYFLAAFMINVAQLLSVILSHVTTMSPISESSHWQALIPVLISRFILNLRHADDSFCATEQFTQSQADCPPDLIGNLGASLWSPFDNVSEEEEESSSIGQLEFAPTSGPVYDAAQYDCEVDQFEREDVQTVPRRSTSIMGDRGYIP